MSIVISLIKRNHRFIAGFGKIYIIIRSVVLLYHISYIILMGTLLNSFVFGVIGIMKGLAKPLIYPFVIWIAFEIYLYFLVIYVRIHLVPFLEFLNVTKIR